MKYTLFSEQEIFNSLLNLKNNILKIKLGENPFEQVKSIFFSPEFRSIYMGLFPEAINQYNAFIFFDTLVNGFDEFYTSFISKYPKKYNEAFVFTIFIDFYIIQLLNTGKVSIKDTDMFRYDKNIYQRYYNMKKSDYKAYLSKWDNLDPLDLIVKYIPQDPSFLIKVKKDDLFVKKNKSISKSPILSINENSFRAFYDFYKFAGYPLRIVDDNIILYVFRISRNEQELIDNMQKFNPLLSSLGRKTMNLNGDKFIYSIEDNQR